MWQKNVKLKTEELTAELKLTKDIEDYLDFDELAHLYLWLNISMHLSK